MLSGTAAELAPLLMQVDGLFGLPVLQWACLHV